MKTVFSLGSNMGDPFAHLRDAVRLIAETPGIHDVVVSPVYVTAPIGGVEQDDFLNLIVVATSDLPPSVLLERAHVIEATGLSTHGLAALMRSCTALLMPSFTEGYGIPLVEAAASGLPVVASDIPVHREIAERFALLRDPLDGPGWIDAIEALARPASPLRHDLARRLEGYLPPSWRAHFEAVGPTLAAL